jgi:hypothetical protein
MLACWHAGMPLPRLEELLPFPNVILKYLIDLVAAERSSDNIQHSSYSLLKPFWG